MKIPEKSPDMNAIINPEPMDSSADTIRYAKEYNDRYLHWDDLRYREFGGSDRISVWRMMKVLRILSYRHVMISDLELSYSMLDDSIHRIVHEMDLRMASGYPASIGIDSKGCEILSVSSMMEEAIASSQIEGASIGTEQAKKILRSDLQPKDRSQRMIVNNYRAMQFIINRSDEPLSPELIKEIHGIVTDGLMDDPYTSGRFRGDDSISVRNAYEDVTYHVPVKHDRIPEMIEGLCDFVNDDSEFIHPVIKGIIIHYVLAFIHPFIDGNGRVSRALFYWYCLSRGYPIVRYISISKAIKEHRKGYGMAYLYSETDCGDITYFIRYNLRMISEAICVLDSYVKRKKKECEEFTDRSEGCGLNHRQSQILMDMMQSGEPVSQYELSAKYQTSVPTIRRDLIILMDKGAVTTSGKDGHRQLYIYVPRE